MANGSVRCGACLQIFRAEDHLISPLMGFAEQADVESTYWQMFEDYVLTSAVIEPTALAEPSTNRLEQKNDVVVAEEARRLLDDAGPHQ